MKNVERINALNKMLLNANVVAYGAMVDLIKRTGRLDLDVSSVGHIDDFPAEIRIFTDNGLICLSITSVYLSGEDNLMVDGYDDDNEKIEGVDVYYDQISEIVYLAKIILEKRLRGVSMAENKDKQNNTKKKEIGLFIAKTLFYFAVLVVLVYLYSYSGIGAAKFIYKDF